MSGGLAGRKGRGEERKVCIQWLLMIEQRREVGEQWGKGCQAGGDEKRGRVRRKKESLEERGGGGVNVVVLGEEKKEK